MNTERTDWEAKLADGVLHISGIARFPNQFCTAGLERLPDTSSDCISYVLTFHRDKEPFCDINGVGPVHHFERQLSPRIQKIKVQTDKETIEIPIRRNEN